MAHHDDLLTLARQMVDRNPGTPVEAELRRAVSTAYYALFHLLVDDGTNRIVAVASIRSRVARTFDHKLMKLVCQEYVKLKPDSTGKYTLPSGHDVPAEIVNLASTFVALQEARHQADYNTGTPVTHLQAETEVGRVEQSFADWHLVQAHPATDTFLAELWCRGIPKR
jgi:hypothetical protein